MSVDEQIAEARKRLENGIELEAIVNTYTEMLEKHPEHKKELDIILEIKLAGLKKK